MDERLEQLALELFEAGAIEFKPSKFKIHEQYPDFPLSPNKINLRMPDNGGKLTPALVEKIFPLMQRKAVLASLRFNLIVGLPRAGEPFAEALSYNMSKALLRMSKKDGVDGQRRVGGIISGNFKAEQRVLAVDDVVSQATTKLEAIRELEKVNLIIAALLVAVDREEGGSECLQSLGYKVFSLYNLSELLIFLFEAGKITLGQLEDSLAYSKEIKKLFIQTLSS